MMRWKLFIFWSALNISCGSTPVEQSFGKPRDDAAQKYQLDFEEIMEFEQGRLGSYEIIASVPSPGSPVIAVEGLPEGAELKGSTLSFLPPCSLSLSNGKFYRGYLSFRIRVSLKSDKDPDSLIQKAGLLIAYRHNDPERPCGE